MARPVLVLAAAVLALVVASALTGGAEAGSDMAMGWMAGAATGFGEEEFMMGSETSRRMLQANSAYISYGALRRDTTPCSIQGSSYYNCRPGASSNPYARRCSNIALCRS